MSNGGSVTREGRSLRTANLLRNTTEQFTYNSDYVVFKLNIRGKVCQTANYASDPDNYMFRARRSKGWKSHKYQHQWEHNRIEALKHEKNRHRKAKKN